MHDITDMLVEWNILSYISMNILRLIFTAVKGKRTEKWHEGRRRCEGKRSEEEESWASMKVLVRHVDLMWQ